MMKYFLILISASIFIISCKNNNKNANTTSTTTIATKDTLTDIPVIELIQNDADDVIATPYFLYKKTTNVATNTTIDSAALSREAFKEYIKPITSIDLKSKKAKESYTEEAFHDLTTQSYSVIIKSVNNNNPIKSITTLLNDETNKLKNSFIIMETTNGDSLFTKKYFWKANKSLSIITEIKYKNNIVKETKQLLNWNDKDLK